jgi:hypothetical protein
MRKIGTEAELEKKRKRGVLVISIFILVILVLGTVGYAFIYSPSPTSENNNPSQSANTITNLGTQWAVNFEGQTFLLSNPPEKVNEIPIEGIISLDNYVGKNIYISSNNNALTAEVAPVLARYASRTQLACYGACEDDLPEKDCTENLIVIKEGEEQKIYQDQSCTFIEGGLESIDAFIYHLLGM